MSKTLNAASAIPAGFLLTILSILVASVFVDVQFSMLEFLAVTTSYSCTLLCVVQARSNYYFGVVTTFLYSLLFYQWGLYALATFNGILVLSLIYGWWRWGPDGRPLSVTDVDSKGLVGYVIFAGFVTALMVVIFKYMGAQLIPTDVFVAALSGVAQLMLDNKKRQTWIVWAIVNVFSIYLFLDQGLILVAIQYMLFLVNTLLGWYHWTKSMKVTTVDSIYGN